MKMLRLREIIKEEMERVMFPSKTIKKIAKMVQQNDHTGAYVEVAKELGDKTLHKKLKNIQSEHEKQGHLSHEIKTKRDKLYKTLMNGVKASFINSKDVYKAL